MNTTSSVDTPTSPAAPSTTGADLSPAPAGTGGVTSPATSSPATSATPTTETKKEPRKSRGQAAFDRATARLTKPAATNTPGATPQVGDGSNQAAVTGTDDASSTASPVPTAGERGAESTTAGSTVTAPDDWPEPMKARFGALPSDDARTLVLDTYKDMHRGFSDSMNKLAQLRKGHEELYSAMETHGIDAKEAIRVLGFSTAFEKNPRETIKQLAARAGVDVWFEKPLAENEIPQFKDAKEMAEYIRQQTLDAVRQEHETRASAERTEREQREAETALRNEIQSARTKYSADWKQHESAIFEKLAANPGLSIDDAYSLTTLPALRKAADDGRRAQAELATLKAQLEKDRKAATAPINGVPGNGRAKDDKFLSPAQRAFERASAKRAQAAHA